MSLRILYIASTATGSTSLQRLHALERLGHDVSAYDPAWSWQGSRRAIVFHYRTGLRFAARAVHRDLERQVGHHRYDVVWVGGGRELNVPAVQFLRSRGRVVVNYNNDDPFGGSEGRSWNTHLRAVDQYDLLVVMREVNVAEARERGARNVLRVFMSYDEQAHAPFSMPPDEWAAWRSDVAFIGNWRPERGPLLADLRRAGVPLSVWGDRWDRAREWATLRQAWRGSSLVGQDYAKAVLGSGVALGLVSKGNRDQHTQRSMEIPALGALLCAERTPEHDQLFRDGVDAVLWSSVDECAAKCMALLADERQRTAIAASGRARVQRLGTGNEATLSRILSEAMQVASR